MQDRPAGEVLDLDPAADSEFTPSLYDVRSRPTSAKAGPHSAQPSIPDKTVMAGGRHEG